MVTGGRNYSKCTIDFSLMIGALYWKQALLTAYSKLCNTGKVLDQQKGKPAFLLVQDLTLITKLAVNSKESLLLKSATILRENFNAKTLL